MGRKWKEKYNREWRGRKNVCTNKSPNLLRNVFLATIDIQHHPVIFVSSNQHHSVNCINDFNGKRLTIGQHTQCHCFIVLIYPILTFCVHQQWEENEQKKSFFALSSTSKDGWSSNCQICNIARRLYKLKK